MNYTLIQQLIGEYAEYEQRIHHAGEANMAEFARWLAMKHSTAVPERAAATNPDASGEDVQVTIGRIIFYLTRYAKAYAKKALEDSVINSIDEFVYLAGLLNFNEGISKSELIRYNRHEKPTGMEIIRRLLALGLATQKPSESDKRSTLLMITPLGMQTIFPLLQKMGVVSNTIVGNLTLDEQMHLTAILEKLEHFHQDLLGKLGNDWELGDLVDSKTQ